MVKGISRQVIVVQSPDPEMFEQAIFILKDEAIGKSGVTEEMLLREANRMINRPASNKRFRILQFGPAWACGGAILTGLVWLLTLL